MTQASLEIQVYYEIAMSIGSSMILKRMLTEALSTYLRKLNCCVGAVFQIKQICDEESELLISCSIPRNYDVGQFFTFEKNDLPLYLTRHDHDELLANMPDYGFAGDDRRYHLMELPDFGLLLLVKSQTFISRSVVKSLEPLNSKLARACIACIQADQLKHEIVERKQAEHELEKHRSNLRELVSERTHALKEINKELEKEIAERTRAEKQLRESEARLLESESLQRAIFNSITDPILVLNPDKKIFMVNHKLLEKRNITLEEARDKYCYEINYGTKEECTACAAEMTFKTGETHSMCRRFVDPSGEHHDYEIYTFPIFGKDRKVDRVIELAHDITQRERYKRAREKLEQELVRIQKLESIGTLAGGIAHDFNNLLMGIKGNASLILMETESSDTAHEKLENIEEYVNSGQELTRQLLGFARGGKYEVKPIDINSLISQSALMFGRTRKEVRIHTDLHDELWTVEADKGQLEQVLLNLYVNAWQAMPKGGSLSIETNNVILDEAFVSPYGVTCGPYVCISVKDTGIGMDEAVIERAFDPFFTTKKQGHGTGLGLASAYGIVKNHGGIMRIESTVGEGAIFYVYLPASKSTVEALPHNNQNTIPGDETILVIDDEKMILTVEAKMLEHLGYKTLKALSGQEALKVYDENKNKIDLIILDMIMPGMNGSEIFKKLKEINPDSKILLASGYSIDGEAENLLYKGCDGFIQKAFNINELSLKVREILDKDCSD